MKYSASVHARIDRDTKAMSEAVLKEIGMSPADAVRLLYRQIALRKEFPVELRVPNSLTSETLNKSDHDEDIECFESMEKLRDSWTSR